LASFLPPGDFLPSLRRLPSSLLVGSSRARLWLRHTWSGEGRRRRKDEMGRSVVRGSPILLPLRPRPFLSLKWAAGYGSVIQGPFSHFNVDHQAQQTVFFVLR
jgi:hypothetical protein